MNPVDLENRILGTPAAARPGAPRPPRAARRGAGFGQVLQDQVAAQAPAPG